MRHRVVQWATGGMGGPCLRAILARPELELAGVFVYNPRKAGLDAGELARTGQVSGVLATDRVQDILALDADVVVHCGRIGHAYRTHDAEIEQLLASGKNVISINGYSHHGHWDDAGTRRLAAACERGRSSLMTAGLNPGFIGEQLAAMATGLCQRFDALHIVESTSVAKVQNPTYLFESLGFGSDPAAVDPNSADWGPAAPVNGMFTEVLASIAAKLGLPLERVETEHQLLPATQDLPVRAGLIARGTTSHITYRWHAIVGGARRLTMEIRWYAETAHLDKPEPPLWELRVRGVPSLHVAIDMERHPADPSRMSPEQQGVAGSVVNAIPWVIAAPPGLVDRPIATPYAGGLACLMG